MEQKWGVKLSDCMKIWRAGCIIQSGMSFPFSADVGAICELLLPLLEPFGPSEPLNLVKDIPKVAEELRATYEAVKEVYQIAMDTDAVAPAIGSTLEWLKAIGGKHLPTDFEEMELDCECYAGPS